VRIGFTYNLKPALAATSSSPHRGGGIPASPDAERSSIDPHYAEWDSQETIDAIADVLAQAGEVVHLGGGPDLPELLRAERPDLVFNMAEGAGERSREAHVPALLEFYHIPYTGGDALCLALTLDKAMTKRVLQASGIPTPAFRVYGPGEVPMSSDLHGPVIVKPIHEGSSIGIGDRSVCSSADEAAQRVQEIHAEWNQAAVVERFLTGREFTCALVGNNSDLRVYPPVEIDFDVLPNGANPVYGFEAKWIWDQPWAPLHMFRCPAEIAPELESELIDAAKAAFRVTGCRDWARIDLRLDSENGVHVLEVNALPGILPDPEQNSCYPKAARAAGVSFDDAILAVVEAARTRYGL
jgi:D-alanine-D-alanine ligase